MCTFKVNVHCHPQTLGWWCVWCLFASYTPSGCSVFHSDPIYCLYMTGSSVPSSLFSPLHWKTNNPSQTASWAWFHARDITVDHSPVMKNVSLACSFWWRGRLCLLECGLTLSESVCLPLPAAQASMRDVFNIKLIQKYYICHFECSIWWELLTKVP